MSHDLLITCQSRNYLSLTDALTRYMDFVLGEKKTASVYYRSVFSLYITLYYCYYFISTEIDRSIISRTSTEYDVKAFWTEDLFNCISFYVLGGENLF